MEEFSVIALQHLEQNLTQRVISLFQNYLGHQIKEVSCKLTDKTLTIIVEDSITRLEQFLAQSERQELAKQVRLHLLKALEPDLAFSIEEAVNVPVLDVICDTKFDTGRTSIVAILAVEPELVHPS